jgi:hypothetical protein
MTGSEIYKERNLRLIYGAGRSGLFFIIEILRGARQNRMVSIFTCCTIGYKPSFCQNGIMPIIIE